MSEVFRLRDTPCYNLRHTSQFFTDPIHSVYNRTESTSYLGRDIWERISAEIKYEESLDEFQIEIKIWKPVECPCKICRTFASNLGLI